MRISGGYTEEINVGQVEVAIDNKRIQLTNLEKVLYQEANFTKAHVLDYYRRIAPYILPHLQDRPLTLKRYPNGVNNASFYQKACPSHRPEWIRTAARSDKNYCLVDDLASLIWVANLACIELHTQLATTDDFERPTMLVFDLDPGPPASLFDCLHISLTIRDMLSELKLKSFPKVSGGKGLHLCIPLNTRVTYEETKTFARKVSQVMENHFPALVVSTMSKNLRKGKVFIDWSQNSRHKTTVNVYSLRAQPKPTVSMPVTWQQIEKAYKKKDVSPLIYSPEQAVRQVEEKGDIFSQVLTLMQHLPSVSRKTTQPTTSPARPISESENENLKTYRSKRNFAGTPEPAGEETQAENIFVIQQHAARTLHYDLRIQIGGTLKSWAVPKGPPLSAGQRRLAVRTEDHPIEYKDFEGEIPKGQYGGGEVIIWDRGTFEHAPRKSKKKDMPVAQALEMGTLEILFHGNKIKGRYILTRLKKTDQNKEQWLLIKSKN
ncbi:MAG: non-homologous end-joining DNA ligase [Phycisphaerae bacterium]|nr:non-homologous end-joining DNA ligase [Phycisphaerae bacterium]